MARYFCLCLAPAIDATVRMGAWPTPDCVIKDATDVFAPGGKGLNVARWLAKRGAFVACGGLLGRDNAAVFEQEMRKYGIVDRFVRVDGPTRVNEMFVTPQGAFKVNRPARAPLLPPGDVADFAGYDTVVLSGSLPKGWPATTYRDLVAAARGAGARVVLDASGDALVEGVKAHPDVIKPNADECAALVGFVPKTPADFARARVPPRHRLGALLSGAQAPHRVQAGARVASGRRRVEPHLLLPRRVRGRRSARYDRRRRHAARRMVLQRRSAEGGGGRQRGVHPAGRGAARARFDGTAGALTVVGSMDKWRGLW